MLVLTAFVAVVTLAYGPRDADIQLGATLLGFVSATAAFC